MLKLAAYSLKDIQQTADIVRTAQAAGMGMDALLAELAAAVEAVVTARPDPEKTRQTFKQKNCPECGSPMMVGVADEQRFYGCKKCRYSELI